MLEKIPTCCRKLKSYFALVLIADLGKNPAVFGLFLKQNLTFASVNTSLPCDHKTNCLCWPFDMFYAMFAKLIG